MSDSVWPHRWQPTRLPGPWDSPGKNTGVGNTYILSTLGLLISKAEKAMAPHSSTVAWKIPWMDEPGRLQSMGSRRVGHNWVTSLSLFAFMHGEGNDNPLQCSCLENPRDRGAWWAAIYGVAQSRTRLKWLSSSSSMKSSNLNGKNEIHICKYS